MDLTYLKELLPDDPETIRDFLSVCLGECLEMMKQLEIAYADQNYLEVKRLAHTIKSSAKNCNFQPLAETSLAVELAVQEERIQDLASAVDAMKPAYDEFIRELKQLLTQDHF